jgi:hypothetical protein
MTFVRNEHDEEEAPGALLLRYRKYSSTSETAVRITFSHRIVALEVSRGPDWGMDGRG